LVRIVIVVSFAILRVAIAVIEPAEVASPRGQRAQARIVRRDPQVLLQAFDLRLESGRFALARPIQAVLEPAGFRAQVLLFFAADNAVAEDIDLKLDAA